MACVYCLTEHGGDCPLDPIAAKRRVEAAAESATKHAETATWAATRAREAARAALEAAAMCEQVGGDAAKNAAALAYRRAEEAEGTAQLADKARANCEAARISTLQSVADAEEVIRQSAAVQIKLRAWVEQRVSRELQEIAL